MLDEAQRIKNWGTKTAQAVKRLRSRYAFVLTGTPIENRIDELHSLMDFLDPAVLGPLFRFNRDFYELDERGRPVGYRNLDRCTSGSSPSCSAAARPRWKPNCRSGPTATTSCRCTRLHERIIPPTSSRCSGWSTRPCAARSPSTEQEKLKRDSP